MAMINEFVEYLEEQVRNHSIYVWGAQGQGGEEVNEKFIAKMESSSKNRKRAEAFWKKQVDAGFGEVLKAFDCSGLIMYWMKNLKEYYENDMTANGIKGKCKTILKADLEKGDFVFRVNDSGRATHVGIVADDELNVIEAYGRDKGVVKRTLNASGTKYWNAFGRHELFEEEIEARIENKEKPEKYIFTRNMKKTSPYMRGEDIKKLQEFLKDAGFSAGSIDGIFGKNTKEAVRLFQKANSLKVDGIAGKETVRTLGHEMV